MFVKEIIFLTISLSHSAWPLFGIGRRCYPKVGCFELTVPFISLLRPTLPPERPEDISTFMYFHTRETPPEGVTFPIYPNIELDELKLNTSKPTYVITHGYTDSALEPWIQKMKDVILKRVDANIFILEYNSGASGLYTQAVGNIRVLGKLGALVFQATGISPSKFHLIGHSLGAQTNSMIAKEWFAMTGEKVERITALDPAGPLFDDLSEEVRLARSDAKMVVVLHTNSGVLGMLSPVGHMDFYFNGGTEQPGCDPLSQVLENDFSSCSHQRAHEYFIESLESQKCMRGQPATLKTMATNLKRSLDINAKERCNARTCVPVGLEATDPQYQLTKGVYIVSTNAKPPYCIPLL